MQLYQKCLSFSIKPPPNSRKIPVYAVSGVTLVLLLDHHERFFPLQIAEQGHENAS